TAVHPSPLSANQGGWFGCKNFSKTNEILRKLGKEEIDWQIENK
ncbi:MAG: uracil-DNA glycosylase, partial [Clostridiales bacterium]|nr:uracil-DNA glycosylase [Clostridiales bacterium]